MNKGGVWEVMGSIPMGIQIFSLSHVYVDQFTFHISLFLSIY